MLSFTHEGCTRKEIGKFLAEARKALYNVKHILTRLYYTFNGFVDMYVRMLGC